MGKFSHYCLVAFCFLSLPLIAEKRADSAKQVIDLSKLEELPKNRSHDWTLGPTGARGWLQVFDGNNNMGTTAKARQIYITKVDGNSPAQGKLKVADVIVGLNGQPFGSDARLLFAKAIQEIESKDGRLNLSIIREGSPQEVTIELTPIPRFAATAPFRCPKTDRILKESAEALIKRGLKNPSIDSNINALALLAMGGSENQRAVKKHVDEMLNKPLKAGVGLECWPFSYANILLCEYYLIQKDSRVLKEIERLSQHIVDGQGPLGSWGHRFANPENGNLHGYGAVNAVGLPLAISLVLAKECGAEVKGLDEAISKSSSLFRRGIGIGTIPYGDGPAQIQFGHDDNGKNSAAAVYFSLLGDKPAAEYFSMMALASHGQNREQGHTGNFFAILWSIPGIIPLGPDATGAWLKEFGWYFDLARDHAKHFPYQGYPRQFPNNAYARWQCPGHYLLSLAAGRQKLRITGRQSKISLKKSTEEIAAIINFPKIKYWELDDKELATLISSPSPIVRKKSLQALHKRNAKIKTSSLDLRTNDPQELIRAIWLSDDLDDIERFLEHPQLVIRIEALRALLKKDKDHAYNAAFTCIAKASKPDPLFTQLFGEAFFNLKTSAQKSGQLLNSTKNRRVAQKGIQRLLNDQDALVASRIAMGLSSLPEKELKPLLPLIVEKSTVAPAGNIMFANKLHLASTEVLAQYEYSEGLKSAVYLLCDESWGRNSRLPKAAQLVKTYKGHGKPFLPQLKKAAASYKGNNEKYHKLITEVIGVINSSPEPKKPLPHI